MARQPGATPKPHGKETMPVWMPNGNDMMASWTRLNGYAIKSVLSYNLELVNFVRHRLEQDIKTINSMMGCDKPDQLLDIGRRFFQTALTEYTENAGKLADISTKLAAETAEHVQEETASIAENMSSRKVA